MTMARRLAILGVPTTDMTSGTPRWSLSGKFPIRENNGPGLQIPDDLRVVYRYCKTLSRDFKGLNKYSEFWNEADNFANAPWNYAAAMKAAYLGYKAGNPDLKVLSSSFVGLEFPEVALKSSLAQYFDIYNFHTYYPVSTYPERMRNIRTMLARTELRTEPLSVRNWEPPGWTLRKEKVTVRI